MKWNRLGVLVVASGACAAVFALTAFVFGVSYGRNRSISPQSVFRLVTDRFVREAPPLESTRELDFQQLRLRETQRNLDIDDADGGGLVRIDGRDAYLLMTGDGRFFHVRIGSSIELNPLELAIPRRYKAEMLAHAEQAAITVRSDWIRYNSLLLDPVADNLYLSYIEWDVEQLCYRLKVAMARNFQATESSLSSDAWQTVFSSEPCLPFLAAGNRFAGHQSGGAMALSVDGQRLFFAVGEFSFDGVNAPQLLAQEPGSSYGRVYSLDTGSLAIRLLSIGHRNPQGVAVLPDGIVITEHGPQGGDEINFLSFEDIDAGRVVNFGWPFDIYGVNYDQHSWPLAMPSHRHDRFEQPAFAFLPSIGISDVERVDAFHPAWDGSILVASLKDRALYRTIVEQGRVRFTERFPVGRRVRDLLIEDGRMILWTDGNNLIVYELLEPVPADVPGSSPESQQTNSALAPCIECHSAPSLPKLADMYGAQAGRQAGVTYSPGLQAANFIWTEQRLVQYLMSPEDVVPDGWMVAPPLDAETATQVVAALRAMGDETERGN